MLRDVKTEMLLLTMLLRHTKGIYTTLEKILVELRKDNPEEYEKLLEKVRDAKTR